jgi:hypothetical protein
MKRMMLRSLIEWLTFFGATESNGGDPDIIFQGKDERSAGHES